MTTPASDFSYSGDPSESTLDEVRFLAQDTDAAMPLLSDTEITYLIDKWWPLYESPTYVAALAAAVIARKFAGVVDVSADGVSVSTAGLSERYREVAEQLRAEYQSEGAVGGLPLLDNIMAGGQWDEQIEPLQFGIGVHDNRWAGRQNYGGQTGAPSFDWDTRSWV